jgi:uracil-DNA glycosylase
MTAIQGIAAHRGPAWRLPVAVSVASTETRSKTRTIESLRENAADCKACPLWKHATQTVFGEGPGSAKCMLVGEQPGDQEDLAGRPFVGPAGAVLDRALTEADLERGRLYVTNAVKHFKWEPRGKRRMHKTPAQQEIEACHQWLERELATVRPDLVIGLGGTAARALFGRIVKLGETRGRIIASSGLPALMVTVHPSYILRVPAEDRDTAYGQFVSDLKLASRFLRDR